MIELTKLKKGLTEVLEEQLDQSDKERAELVEALTDRLKVDFEIFNDEEDEEEVEEGDSEQELSFED